MQTLILFIILIFLLYIVSFIFSISQHLFFKSIHKNRLITIVLGFIGIIIHELSHIIFSVLFGHKVQSFKLFSTNSNQIQGYVVHSYSKDSLYQRLGVFFISFGPLIVGLILLHTVLEITEMHFYQLFTQSILIYEQSMVQTLESLIYSIIQAHKDLISYLIPLSLVKFFVIFLMVSVILFMSPSKQDLKNSLKDGFLTIILISFIIFSLEIIGISLKVHITIILSLFVFLSTFSVVFILFLSMIVTLIRLCVSLRHKSNK